MSQSLELDLKTNSDVPQAMEKAKVATESFNKQVENISKNTRKSMDASKESTVSVGKQVDDISKKFSTSFKDIFLSFLGPMALVATAVSMISRLIEENQKKHREANQAAIDGTNELMSAEDKYYAKKRDNERKDKEDREQAKMSREDITKDFLLNDPLGRAYLYKKQGGQSLENLPGWMKKLRGLTGSDEDAAEKLSRSQEAQMFAQTVLMQRRAENPLPVEKDKTASSFKSPEGFGNVIGVGPNPVLEAMNEQLEIQKQSLAELQKISGSSGTPTDFTKTPQK
jgi:hypothetical protein